MWADIPVMSLGLGHSGRGSLTRAHPTPLPVWHLTLRRSLRQNSAGFPESAMCARLAFTPVCTWVVFTPTRPRICCEFVTISGGRVVRGHLRREKLSQMDLACRLCASLSTKMNRPHACRFPPTPTNEELKFDKHGPFEFPEPDCTHFFRTFIKFHWRPEDSSISMGAPPRVSTNHFSPPPFG